MAKEVQEEMQRNVAEGVGASVGIGRKYVGTRSWKTEQPQHGDLELVRELLGTSLPDLSDLVGLIKWF